MANPLREKYGGKGSQAMNRAIRAELAGGADALDALSTAHRHCLNLGIQDLGQSSAPPAVVYRAILDIVDSMEDDIRRRHHMPQRPDRDDGRRWGAPGAAS